MMGRSRSMPKAGQAVDRVAVHRGGAMAPVSVVGDADPGPRRGHDRIAYAQLINPGCPVIFGAFVTSST